MSYSTCGCDMTSITNAMYGVCAAKTTQDRNYFAPLHNLTDQQFTEFKATFLFIVTLYVGWCSEILVGVPLMQSGNAEAIQALWKYAQCLFPLFVTIAIYSAPSSVFGIPFLVLGMWKLGFPETTAYFCRALTGKREKYGLIVADFCDGLGLLIHHSMSAFIITFIAAGANKLTRNLLTAMIPLVVQHLIVLTRYFAPTLYNVSMMCAEVWFELEMFGSVFTLDKRFQVASFIFIISHWLFMLAALLNLLYGGEETAQAGETVKAMELQMMQMPTRSSLDINGQSPSDVKKEMVESTRQLSSPPETKSMNSLSGGENSISVSRGYLEASAESIMPRGYMPNRRTTVEEWRQLFGSSKSLSSPAQAKIRAPEGKGEEFEAGFNFAMELISMKSNRQSQASINLPKGVQKLSRYSSAPATNSARLSKRPDSDIKGRKDLDRSNMMC
mmetsp:Transcript_6691/g.11057  ORF Transcript_6691/g.11057 Transcript_6691/m.11057 type:complete len:444 (+) Transcript_6691:93-1424(+)